MTHENPDQFQRLPETDSERALPDRATRAEITDWWDDRFNIPPSEFEGFSFWEKGAGKIWICAGAPDFSPRIEALGLRFMRTRQKYWKPTTNAVQRWGHLASRNVIELNPAQAARFVDGDDQSISWDGDWGYVIATRRVAGSQEALGVGLYTHGDLQSMIPKGRRRDLTR